MARSAALDPGLRGSRRVPRQHGALLRGSRLKVEVVPGSGERIEDLSQEPDDTGA